MFFLEKISILLDAQQEYLRLADLARVEIERGLDPHPKILDQGVRIVQNKVLLDQALFESLKRQCKQYSPEERDEGDFALAFPVVRRVKGKGREQKNFFYPAFVLEISSIFRGGYHSMGWDLSDFQVLPIVPNLIEYFGLQEPEIDSLITTEGIHRFLQDAFKRSFATMQDFILQVDLPNHYGCLTKRSAYLVRLNVRSFNTLLRGEIHALKQQLLDLTSLPVWTQLDHPLMEFLFGVPELPRQNTIFWAAAPGTVSDSFQAAALKHSENNRLTAVLGGPGSGKTELSFQCIVQQIWKRAHVRIHEQADLNNLCVFAATNNSPIDKFKARLETKAPSPFFYLPGGKQKVIQEECLPKIRKAIERLQSSSYDESVHAQARQRILGLEAQLGQAEREHLELQKQRQQDQDLISDWNGKIEEIEQSIAEIEILQNQYSDQDDYTGFPVVAYKKIQADLEQAWRELPCEGDSWSKRATDWLNVVSDKSVFQRLARRVLPSWLNTQNSDNFRFTTPIDREQLVATRAEVERLLDSYELWQEAQNKNAENQQKIEEKRKVLVDLEESRREVQERLGQYPTTDFYDRFYKENHALQVELFQASWEFLQQEALLRRGEVVETLRIYESALSGNEEAEIRLNPERFFTRLSLVFPVLGSTLQSLASMVPLKPNLISLAILDEAGATPIHQPIPLLVRAQKAVVLGDPKQIEPIINLCADTIEDYCNRAFLSRGLSFRDYERYAPTAKDSATAFHRAAGASGETGDLGEAIVLRNHYRSVPAIIGFCSPNYPAGLNIMSSDRVSALGPNLIAYSVEGLIQNRVNTQEVQAVETVVDHLLRHGYTMNQIGVLSPFFHQASALRSRLRQRWRDFSYYNAGTVHDFQGGEKPVIILSPFQCEQSFLSYINRRPNLLNTAVSRAEELFILIGNLAELEAFGETRRLIQYCRQHGEIRSLPGG